MNETRVREVLEIEKQAQELLAAAKRDADRLPADAEAEALKIVERAREQAREEAKRLVEQARAEDESARIIAKMQQKMGDLDKLAAKNFERAVAYVLESIAGRA